MHIEPGYIAPAKVMLANVAAVALLGCYGKRLLARPANVGRMLLAAAFFTLFMESFHVPVGPSELHFVGAMAVYLTLGFLPTLFGFAVGLLLQGLLFEAADLPYLAVNSLSLTVPLIAVHRSFSRTLRDTAARGVSWRTILKLDAVYYSGVAAMVGFWLLIGDVAVPFAAWAAFAASYLPIVAVEPLVSYAAVRLLKRYQHTRLVMICFAVNGLRLAS